MVIHSPNSFGMPLLLSAFSNVLPQVIRGQPIGRERKPGCYRPKYYGLLI